MRIELDIYILICLLFIALIPKAIFLLDDRRYITGGLLILLGCCGFLSLFTSVAFCDPQFWRAEWLALSGAGDPFRCDDRGKLGGMYNPPFCGNSLVEVGSTDPVAAVPDRDKQIAIIGASAEGSSIRSIERMTGIHRDTIMCLGVKVGKGCADLLNGPTSAIQPFPAGASIQFDLTDERRKTKYD